METESWNETDACEAARASASAAMDGEGVLDPHVERCPACRAYVVELRTACATLAVLREGGGEDLWPSIAARVRGAEPARRRKLGFVRLAAAGIGFAATTLALRGLGEGARGSRESIAGAWAALHPESAGDLGLSAAPEQQLPAALGRGAEERR
jgi:hypothetical protein